MASSQQLVHRWQERLAVGERLLTNSSPRLRWLGRVYVRLYRFLLSVYGHGQWRTDDASSHADELASRMPFVDLTAHGPGGPAKSIDTIRETLKRVHAANPEHESGSLTGTLVQERNEWVVVAAESGLVEPWKCVEFLFRHDIKALATIRGADVQVEVRRLDFERATKLIAIHKVEFRTPARSLWRTNAPVAVASISFTFVFGISLIVSGGIGIFALYLAFAYVPVIYWPQMILALAAFTGLEVWFIRRMQRWDKRRAEQRRRKLADDRSRHPWSDDTP